MKFIKKIGERESFYNSIIGWKFYKWGENGKKKFFAISQRIGKLMIKFVFDDWKISFLVFTNKPHCEEFEPIKPKYQNKIITIW